MKWSCAVAPDYQGLLNCITRRDVPRRVHFIELFLDSEIQDALHRRFTLAPNVASDDPYAAQKREIALQRWLGYDYVRVGLENIQYPLLWHRTADTADNARASGRAFVDLHRGPIATWDDFERYPWPDPTHFTTRALEWYEKHLPDDMCVIGSQVAHFAELLSWLMGYETLCLALYDQPDLVAAIRDRLLSINEAVVVRLLQFERVRMIWGSDDMGFRTGTLLSPDALREYVLPGHRRIAALAHAAGRPYLLHSCGQLDAIMEDLIEDVRIDARHSFEDAIEPVTSVKQRFGRRVALLGGIDVDFLCRATPEQIRGRVRDTLTICQPDGGYCLGSGNSIANYIPLENYLAMLDEGRAFGR